MYNLPFGLAIAMALADWLAVWRGWQRARWVTKPGVIVLLGIWFATQGGLQGWNLWFAAGLLAALAGDVLLLLSDGFYEYADARGEQFGEARVRDLVAAGHGATASELLALVQKAVDAFAAGAAQEDDMTAVVVRRIASP